MGGKDGTSLMNVLGHMQNYIWRKNDTLGGLSNSIGWVTTSASKERMLNYLKDYFERGMLIVRSMDTLDEMKTVTRQDGTIAAAGRGKDDRVIASALAAAAYAEQLQPRLIAMNLTKLRNRAMDELDAEERGRERTVVSKYLKNIGLGV
jgi:hypothetical protein